MDINCQLLAGEDFSFIKEGHLRLTGNIIAEANKGYTPQGIDLKHCLAVPGLINAHTHIGDSFALDACTGLCVSEAVGRNGKKWQLYQDTPRDLRVKAMRETAEWMLSTGTTCFADFREGGIEGIKDIKKALKNVPIKPIILGRNLEEDEFESCDGLGLNIPMLEQISPKNKLLAVHAGEIKNEIGKALAADPDIIVHFTKATKKEITQAKKQGISVILCPRSNASLGAGFPPAKELFESCLNVCLGTDNVMINTPDMWREMEFLYKISQITGPLTPKQVLSAATVNGAKAYRLNSGFIAKGKNADIIFIDMNSPNLKNSRDILATIVTRTYPENIETMIIKGELINIKEYKRG